MGFFTNELSDIKAKALIAISKKDKKEGIILLMKIIHSLNPRNPPAEQFARLAINAINKDNFVLAKEFVESIRV